MTVDTTRITLPTYFMLLYWVVLQVVGSMPGLAGAQSGAQSSGGVAFMAHIGGFVAGVVLIRLFTKPDLLAAARRQPPLFTTNQPWRY